MKGKIVFITGASSGIGEGCARKFASQGSDLILNARNVAKLEELKVELEAKYGVRICLLPFKGWRQERLLPPSDTGSSGGRIVVPHMASYRRACYIHICRIF